MGWVQRSHRCHQLPPREESGPGDIWQCGGCHRRWAFTRISGWWLIGRDA